MAMIVSDDSEELHERYAVFKKNRKELML